MQLQKDGPLPRFRDLATAEGRAKFAERMKEPLVKFATLIDELSVAEENGPTVATASPKMSLQSQRVTMLAMASALGNDTATKQLATLAASGDKDEAIAGKMGQNLAAWLLADHDAAAQDKVLDAMETLAKDNPASGEVALAFVSIKSIPNLPAAASKRIDGIFVNTLTSPTAKQVQAQIARETKQKDAIGKPFVLAGKTSEGKDFSTKEYLGKVVLVDFWATWCPPCRAEVPRVKAMYDKYHDKGLEIVGVSCDGDGDALAKYTKDNDMPWVQLWDKEKQGGKPAAWHALALEWNVMAIPQMFLIDRKGVLRTVEARGEMEKMIPELIDEKVSP